MVLECGVGWRSLIGLFDGNKFHPSIIKKLVLREFNSFFSMVVTMSCFVFTVGGCNKLFLNLLLHPSSSGAVFKRGVNLGYTIVCGQTRQIFMTGRVIFHTQKGQSKFKKMNRIGPFWAAWTIQSNHLVLTILKESA